MSTPETPPQPPEPGAEPIVPQTPPPKKRGGCLRIGLIVVGAFIALIFVIALFSGGDDNPTAPATASDYPASTSENLPEDEAADAEDSSAADDTPTPKATNTKPVITKRTYAGSGDRIIKIKKPGGDPEAAVIAQISGSGGGNFVVWTLDQSLDEQALLVNTIGSYKGTVPIDFDGSTVTKRLKIQSSGSWKVVLKPLTAARRFSSTIGGRGDDIVIYTSDAKVANLRHSGSSNFAVWFYSDYGTDLLVNEIGSYKGQSALTGLGVLVITASGSWTIKAK